MKKEEIFEMTKHLDEKYILEAAAEPKKNIKLKKRIITFTLAAALTASLSIGAFAAYKALNRESVGKYYDSSTMDKMEENGYVSGKTTENDHFRFTLETAMKDEACISTVLTITPRSEDAIKYVTNNTELKDPYNFSCILTKFSYADTGEKIEVDPNAFSLMTDINNITKNNDFACQMIIPYNNSEAIIDPSRPIRVEFSADSERKADVRDDLFKGLSLEIRGIKQAKTVKFYSDTESTLDFSEFSVLVQGGTFDDRVGMDTDDSIVYFKDGTSKPIFDLAYSFVAFSDKNGKMQESFDLKTLFDPETVDYVFYAGHTYKRK